MLLGHRIKEALQLQGFKNESYIRVGRDNDGGYVMVNDIRPTDYLISMGIANDVSFEQGLQDKVLGIDMYDMSISSLPGEVRNGTFFKERVGADSHHVFNRIPEGSDAILKIDIEGGEWGFFRSLSEEQTLRFRQIVMETHWAIDYPGIHVPNMPVEVLEKINKTHQLVMIHANNYAKTVNVDGFDIPQVLELTYLRKDSYVFGDFSWPPEELIMPNNPTAKELELNFYDS